MSFNPPITWYRSEISKSDLSKLTKRDSLRGMASLLVHFGLLVITGVTATFCALAHYWLSFVILLIVHGTFYSFLGYAGLGHELVHRTVFVSRNANDLLFSVISFLTWNNKYYFRKSHACHHQFTIHDDKDYEVKLPQKSVLKQWMFLVFFDFALFKRALKIHIENSFGIIKGSFGQRLFPKNSANYKMLIAWARILLIGHVALATIFFLSGLWPLIFIITLAPFFGTFLNRVLAQGQHYGMAPNSSDFRDACRTVLLHPFLASLYWQMNYHTEHHMYPAVPFFQLRKLRDIISSDLPEPTSGLTALLKVMRQKA